MAFLQNNYIHKQYELTTNLTFFLSKHNSRSYHSGRDVVVPLFLQVNLRPFSLLKPNFIRSLYQTKL